MEGRLGSLVLAIWVPAPGTLCPELEPKEAQPWQAFGENAGRRPSCQCPGL